MDQRQEWLRSIPPVDALLRHEEVEHWLATFPRSLVVSALRHATDQVRAAVLEGACHEFVDPEHMIALAEEELARLSAPSLRRVINATGIVLHTGLGRAPLCDAAVEAVAEVTAGYSNLEFDLDEGRRGKRTDHVRDWLKQITGAPGAVIVNNNAAATFLILNTLAAGREVVISRGQLIEIGGSYRLPDITRASGALPREVGTTNRTRLTDYEAAVNDATAMLLHVHSSNYRIVGFSEETPLSDLATLARERGLILVDDLGSGALLDLTRLGLPYEPWAAESIQAGADLVCFSGDKLLGGPQCGIIVGRAELIERLERNPLMRAFRVDKMTLAALEATLRHYRDEEEAGREIPTLRLLSAPLPELEKRAKELCSQLCAAIPGQAFHVGTSTAYAGGGALPTAELPSVAIQWRPPADRVHALLRALRQAETPIIARAHEGVILLDLRTLFPADEEDLIAALEEAYLALHDPAPQGLPLPILNKHAP